MAIIPAAEKVFMVSNSTNTTYSGSASLKAMQQWYTMQDVIDTVGTPTIPYKVYSAIITQTGGAAPVATVIENTIGVMAITRNNAGIYFFVNDGFDGFADAGKVLCFVSNGAVGGQVGGTYVPPINGVQLLSAENVTSSLSDNIISNCSIEIRLYN